MSDSIYMDNAATTATRPEALEAMLPYFGQMYGNASSVYSLGRDAKKSVELAREKVAAVIGAKPDEIFFTSGGTESDNWAIRGLDPKKGRHIITSAIEHHAVLHTCEYMAKRGYEITYLPVNENGAISVDDLRKAIRPDTALITIMFANNEIGTIQPIAEIGAIAKEHEIAFHTDAVQAYAHAPIDVNAMNIDMLSLSAHKIYGPKGVGALYVRKKLPLHQLMFGGAQEKGRRAGTENTPGIVGLGVASELLSSEMDAESKRLTSLRDRLIYGITSSIPHSKLNGDPVNRLPGNVNISFEFIEGESMLLLLDMKGISASSGSACTSGSLDPSHVLLAIGLPHEKAHGSLRLSLGHSNTDSDVDKTLEELPAIVSRLRDMSPLYEDYIKTKAGV
jgi:cysteine desulfurase